MFYCKECALEAGWPETLFKSHGLCELCKKVDDCNDLPSAMLPLPRNVDLLPSEQLPSADPIYVNGVRIS